MLDEDGFDAEEVGRRLQERSKVSDEVLRAAFYERRLAELRAQGLRQVDAEVAVSGKLTSLEEFGEAGFIAVVEDRKRKRFVLGELNPEHAKNLTVGQTVWISQGDKPPVVKKRELERDDDWGFER